MAKTIELKKNLFTYDDVNRLPDDLYEIIDGERRDMTPTGFEHGGIEFNVAYMLKEKLKDKGFIAVGEVGIIIRKNPLRIRAADIIYIAKTKLKVPPKGMLEIPPDLIIEIISPANALWEMTEKVKDYLSFGVERVLLIDPQTKTVSVYQAGKRDVSLYSFDEEVHFIGDVNVRLKEVL